ncbi:MAG: HAMP domain-containing protein [archaeon]
MSDEKADQPNVVLRVFRAITPTVLRRRFALKFGLVLLLMAASVGTIGVVATQGVADQVEENVENEYRGLAAQEANLIETWMDRHSLSIQLLSTNTVWGSNDAEELRRNLRIDTADLSGVNDMFIVDQADESGQWTITAGANTDGDQTVNEAGRPWLKNMTFETADQTVTSQVYRVDGQAVVGIASPVGATQGRMLVAEISITDITTEFRGEDQADGGFTQVVNGSNVVQLSDRSEDVLTNYASASETLRPIENAQHLRETSDQEAGVIASMEPTPEVLDESYTVGYAPIEGTDWAVLVHAPQSSVFGFVKTVSDWGLIATAGGVLLIGLVGVTMGASTSRSINRLRRRAETMEAGHFGVEIHSGRVDDIGRLYDSFANMRDALKGQIQEAEQARKEAEVSRAEAIDLSQHLQKKAEEYSVVMQQCSKGDLTQRMDVDRENEAMTQIAENFNEMIDELEKTTGQLKRFAEEVDDAGAVVTQSAESVRDASEQVAASIQTISDDADDRRNRLEAVAKTLDETIGQLETVSREREVDIGEQLDELRDTATTIETLARETEQTMAESENVAGAAEEQAAELNQVTERAEKLTRYARPLGDVLGSFETEAEHEFYFPTGPGSPPINDKTD